MVIVDPDSSANAVITAIIGHLRNIPPYEMYEYVINLQEPGNIISFISTDEELARKYWMGRFSYNNNNREYGNSSAAAKVTANFRLSDPEFDEYHIFQDYLIINKNRISTYR